MAPGPDVTMGNAIDIETAYSEVQRWVGAGAEDGEAVGIGTALFARNQQVCATAQMTPERRVGGSEESLARPGLGLLTNPRSP